MAKKYTSSFVFGLFLFLVFILSFGDGKNNTQEDRPRYGGVFRLKSFSDTFNTELDPIKTDETSQKPEMELGQAEMAKQFLQGFRVRAMIRLVDGHIVKTNASYVKKVKGNDYVTLFDMNMGELLKADEKLQQFQSLEEIRNISTARRLLKGVPGFQIEPADRIEIQFR